jgi:dihydrofolate synthase/folylpolyglutamate synthase
MNLALLPETAAAPASREILSRLMQLHPKSIDLSLGRLERLLARLGHPERRLPPVVHVAGTNGKGSTIAYMRAALEAAGQRTHVYISPHLVRFNERIRLAGGIIDDDHLQSVLQDCENANGGEPITFFEITTAAAFLAFADTPGDVLLLETGLGGRLDATNVVERPLLTAITAISLDHQQFLGDDVASIAGEKAGILKPGVPGLIAAQEPDAAAAIRARADAIGAPLLMEGQDWQISAGDGRIRFVDGTGAVDQPMPVLAGLHQLQNAGLAIATLRRLGGFTVSDTALSQGLTGARWPGRLQQLQGGRLGRLLPPGAELWLDGGHNPAAGLVLADSLRAWNRDGTGDTRPLHMIFGMLETKDARRFLAPFADLHPTVWAMRVPDEPASLSAEAAAAAAHDAGLHATTATGLRDALAAIAGCDDGGVPPRVLICGSLYLAGHVLAEDGSLPD